MLTTEQKLLSAASHLAVFVSLPIIIPLVILLISKDGYVKTQAMEALGFHIILLIAATISGILVIILIGIPLLIAVGLVALIFPIIAAIKVFNDEDYSYPISGKFIRKSI
ncbi:DUF4870 domain-containing protein [Clostridium sp. D2Q-11]|uniref:DUF4870 domain-containing protein n=1 Tax=Anaeromonas frigoriresistens TaxID=2683708 RepID=A0A942UVY9_9FIRM|nr:DUF4870 domain-containing protein [Anaeromonas frigoriresistens]MBS4540063.1 DUF4870 domain-containing protein [Anaeromonas frigoriresistens]